LRKQTEAVHLARVRGTNAKGPERTHVLELVVFVTVIFPLLFTALLLMDLVELENKPLQ
jgi:hypothetical protein